ncbi:MAG: DUF308 domain-containing protein [Gammaproteobacteria bacterium]|nr:DUF308 domain-containing protein [Gammaproteobacteria bacterium]
MTQDIQTIETVFVQEIKKNSKVVIITGAVLVFLGLLAMGAPLIAGLSLAMIIGIMLILAGLGQLIFAIKTDRGFLSLTIAALTFFIGLYMLANLKAALGSLTIFLAIYLIVSGLFEIMMAIQIRPHKGWGWALFSGIISALLGIMIWSQYPLSGVWAIGILIGLRLFFSGWMLLMLGLTAKNTAVNESGI